MSNYKEAMQKKSDFQLYQIVNYDYIDYNDDAIKSAESELKSRMLTEERIQEVIAKIEGTIEKEKLKKERRIHLTERSKASIKNTIDAIHPATPKKDETFIKLIAAYLGILLVMGIYQDFPLLTPQYLSLYSLETIITIVLLSISIYGLLYRKRIG